MEVKNDQWRRLDKVVDALLAMPPDTVKNEEESDDMKPPETDHEDG